MPFPMVHFASALLLPLTARDPGQLWLGLIAPDAYKNRAGHTLADKERTHLWQDREAGYALLEDASCFCQGYGLHLLLDHFWEARVIPDYFAEGGDARAQRQRYVEEMTLFDLFLYQEMRMKDAVWKELTLAPAQGFGMLVAAEEVDQERIITLSWYDAQAPVQAGYDALYQHLDAKLRQFVEELRAKWVD